MPPLGSPVSPTSSLLAPKAKERASFIRCARAAVRRLLARVRHTCLLAPGDATSPRWRIVHLAVLWLVTGLAVAGVTMSWGWWPGRSGAILAFVGPLFTSAALAGLLLERWVAAVYGAPLSAAALRRSWLGSRLWVGVPLGLALMVSAAGSFEAHRVIAGPGAPEWVRWATRLAFVVVLLPCSFMVLHPLMLWRGVRAVRMSEARPFAAGILLVRLADWRVGMAGAARARWTAIATVVRALRTWSGRRSKGSGSTSAS